jgi:hypothetical protein
VYADKSDGPDFEKINEVRFKVLEDQLQLYDETASSWSIWLWKDIGFQGMIYVDEDTPYIKLMAPFLKKKKVSGSLDIGWKTVLIRHPRYSRNWSSMLGAATIPQSGSFSNRFKNGLEPRLLRSRTVTQKHGTRRGLSAEWFARCFSP